MLTNSQMSRFGFFAAGTDVKVGRRDRIRVSAEWQADDSNQADVPNRELFRSE